MRLADLDDSVQSYPQEVSFFAEGEWVMNVNSSGVVNWYPASPRAVLAVAHDLLAAR
jgi:hypothetical protein